MEMGKAREKRRHIPVELVEKILFNLPVELVEKILLSLPVKSLLRFSSVSKAWRSMINGTEFVKTYRGREMLVMRIVEDDGRALVCPISSMSSSSSTPWAMEAFVRPFTGTAHLDPYYSFLTRDLRSSYLDAYHYSIPTRGVRPPYLDASCGGLLWCVEFENSVCLCNPSTRAYRKLPVPLPSRFDRFRHRSTFMRGKQEVSNFAYGVGYDAVADDYKVLKLHRSFAEMPQLYSLRSDSWERIPIVWELKIAQRGGVCSSGLFLSGSLYWVVRLVHWHQVIAVVSFHLSSHQFGVLAFPESCSAPRAHFIDATVLMGKIGVSVNHVHDSRFDLWVMEEDHVWSKEIVVNYANIPALCHSYLKPLFFYDHSGNLIKAITTSSFPQKMFVYQDTSTLQVQDKDLECNLLDTCSYVECLLSVFP